MKQAMMSFEHDLEDGWYRMTEPEPHREKETWDQAINAYNFAKQKGWEVIWVGSDQYKPSGIKFDEPRFGA